MHCRTLQTLAPLGASETTLCTSVRIRCAEVAHG